MPRKKVSKKISLKKDKKSVSKVATPIVNAIGAYERIIKKALTYSFPQQFVKDLTEKLLEVTSPGEVATHLANISSRVTILNKENFLVKSKFSYVDIGREAFEESDGDLDKFVRLVASKVTIERAQGNTDIDISTIPLFLSTFIPETRRMGNECTWKLRRISEMLGSIFLGTYSNPFKLDLLPGRVATEVLEKMGLTGNYRRVLWHFLESMRDVVQEGVVYSFPQIRVIGTVQQNVRKAQTLILGRVFALWPYEVNRFIKDVAELDVPSPELFVALDGMAALKHLSGLNYQYILSKLREVREDERYAPDTEQDDDLKYVVYGDEKHKKESADIERYLKMTRVYYEKETFLRTMFDARLSFTIDCKGLKTVEEILPFVRTVEELVKVKEKVCEINYTDKDMIRIIFRNVGEYNLPFVNNLRKEVRKMGSTFNRKFEILVEYSNAMVKSIYASEAPEYIRVISDIHADVNESRNYLFDFGKDFVVNCGDTSGSAPATKAWVRTFMREGVFVAGNHLGYEAAYPERDGVKNLKDFNSTIDPLNTKNAQTKSLRDIFAYNSPTLLLSNDTVEKYGMLFIGTTLYTDFNLYGEDNQATCMVEAARSMNDFKRCYFYQRKPKEQRGEGEHSWEVVPFTVEHHLQLFKICKGYIRNRLNYIRQHEEDFKNLPIVVVTHHTPLPYCISDKYKNDPLSAAFASDLRDFIREYPNIRLWCSGHVHEPYDFIFNETRFVACPWGYFNENNFDINNYGLRIPISQIKSVKSWRQILKDQIKNGSIKDYGIF